jgi:DNA-binding CsgD family transcriptional regulator
VQDAVATIEKATDLAQRAGNQGLVATTLVGLAGVQRRAGRQWHAVSALDRALRIAADIGDRVLACRTHEALANAFEEMSAADKALEHYRLYMSLRDTMHEEEQRREIAEVDLRLALERAQQERDLYRVRSEHLQADLEVKVRELASASLASVQNNRVLDSLEERVVERFKGQRDAKLLVREVCLEIAALRDAAGEWRSFEERLDALHKDFIGRLRALYPDLTQAQLMICALLRANFDTRDVAAALCLSERTVENHRYRLRRKLGLSADVNLASYLASV